MASPNTHADGEEPQAAPNRSGRGNSVRDNNGVRGTCTSCSEHYKPLLIELENTRWHSVAMRRVRANQLKNNPSVRSLGQNHKARWQWLWTHALDSHGSWIGHAECIAKLTATDKNTLACLRRVYCEQRAQRRLYPASAVLKDNELLKMLIYEGDSVPEDWASLARRRQLINQRIVLTADNRTPVALLPDSSLPPLHANVFKKRMQKVVQLERFKEFVLANCVPTGRQLRGKTHYLVPSIRRLRPPNKLKDGASDAQRARHTEMTHASLTFQLNDSLFDLEPELTPISHDTIWRWFKELFPHHGLSPVQSDYCDTCAKLKQQIDGARRSKQHLLDNGSAAAADIRAKELLITSYESNLRQHRELATKEQREYKERIVRTAIYFQRYIRMPGLDLNAASAANHCLSNEPDAEVVLACDFQMGKLVPHWGQTAQPGKTYYYQKLMHHVFGIVDSSNSRMYVYVIDETVAGDKDANHVCSFLFDYVERMVQPCARFLPLYLDAAPYFKSKYVVWLAAEMVARGRFQRVVLSYMVPGHTKFEPDSLFSQIANRFYKTDVFNTRELLHVIGACDAVPHEAAPRSLRHWKSVLAAKYVDVPRITNWNVMVVESSSERRGQDLFMTDVCLRVKRSVTQDQYEKAFRGGSTTFNLLQRAVSINADAVPTQAMSAACDDSMKKPLAGDKLRNIAEMYSSYVPRDRWPIQLTEALQVQGEVEDDTGNSENEQVHVPVNSQYDAKAIRVAELMGTPEGAARAHIYLRRVEGASRLSDVQLADRLRNDPQSGIRTMPRRKKARTSLQRK